MTTKRRGRCTSSSARRVGLHGRLSDAEFHAEEMQAQRDRALKWARAWRQAAHRQRDELRCWQGEAVASVYWEAVAHERAIEIAHLKAEIARLRSAVQKATEIPF